MRTRTGKSLDYIFVGLLAFLIVAGFVVLASASSDVAQARFGDSYRYLTHQLLYGFSIGVIGFLVGVFVPYRVWQRIALPLLILSILLVLLVFTPLGVSAKGGDRWLAFGSVVFQPGELLKLTFFIYLAAWFSKNPGRTKRVSGGFLPFLILVGGVMGLLILQPSLSTAIIVFAASIATYFTAGGRLRFIVVAVLIIALAVSVFLYFNQPRLQRILTFLNPSADTRGAGYHINEAQTAIGSGGITGVGFGQSTAKLRYLPEPIGDSIFAIIAEEFGFVGSVTVITLFLFFIFRGLSIARHAGDNFGRFLVTGFVCIIGLQAFVNIAAISGLIPLTGVPLPFISYGGTALAVFMTMSGIIVHISRSGR